MADWERADCGELGFLAQRFDGCRPTILRSLYIESLNVVKGSKTSQYHGDRDDDRPYEGESQSYPGI